MRKNRHFGAKIRFTARSESRMAIDRLVGLTISLALAAVVLGQQSTYNMLTTSGVCRSTGASLSPSVYQFLGLISFTGFTTSPSSGCYVFIGSYSSTSTVTLSFTSFQMSASESLTISGMNGLSTTLCASSNPGCTAVYSPSSGSTFSSNGFLIVTYIPPQSSTFSTASFTALITTSATPSGGTDDDATPGGSTGYGSMGVDLPPCITCTRSMIGQHLTRLFVCLFVCLFVGSTGGSGGRSAAVSSRVSGSAGASGFFASVFLLTGLGVAGLAAFKHVKTRLLTTKPVEAAPGGVAIGAGAGGAASGAMQRAREVVMVITAPRGSGGAVGVQRPWCVRVEL
jgi:hypothetical protein